MGRGLDSVLSFPHQLKKIEEDLFLDLHYVRIKEFYGILHFLKTFKLKQHKANLNSSTYIRYC